MGEISARVCFCVRAMIPEQFCMTGRPAGVGVKIGCLVFRPFFSSGV